MPEPEVDPESIEPTAAEIAAASKAEDAAAKRADKPTARRGPGRPAGSRNKSSSASSATKTAAATKTTATKPSTPAASVAGEAEAAATRRKAQKEARERRVKELKKDALEARPVIARTVGQATGIPTEFLVNEDGQLTEYGEVLAPSAMQLDLCISAYVRAEETPAGQQMLDSLDKFMPYVLMIGAAGAVGMYGLTVVKATAPIKQMVAQELATRAQQESGAPGGATG